MDDQLAEKIRALLADPQAVDRIVAIAGTLGNPIGGGDPQPEPPPPTQAAQPVLAPQHGGFGGPPPGGRVPGDPRLELLRALRPLVREEKRGRLDDLVRIATVASLLGNIKN